MSTPFSTRILYSETQTKRRLECTFDYISLIFHCVDKLKINSDGMLSKKKLNSKTLIHNNNCHTYDVSSEL